jgi:hypothetical protein
MIAGARSEAAVQRAIESELGALPFALLLRNNVGVARNVDRLGRERFTRFGLGVGSPDLIFILAPHGRLVGLEVKREGERATSEQLRVHDAWRQFGGFVAVVHSVAEARAALEQARTEKGIAA